MNGPPLPSLIYNTKQEAIDYIKTFAINEGYAVSISESESGAYPYVALICYLGGKYRSTNEIKKRKKDSKKCGCPFKMRIKRHLDGRWYYRIENPQHNHPPIPPIELPQARQLDEEKRQFIRRLCMEGVRPKLIRSSILSTYPNTLITINDIYNEVARYRKEIKENNEYYVKIENKNTLPLENKRKMSCKEQDIRNIFHALDVLSTKNLKNQDDITKLKKIIVNGTDKDFFIIKIACQHFQNNNDEKALNEWLTIVLNG